MLRLVREIRQFWQDGTAALDDPAIAHLTLQQFVDQRGYSLDFQHHYLVPLTAAIWSTAPAGVLDFPIAAALRFLHNHGVLQLRGHEWRTVVGGSHAYVDALRARLDADVHCATPVLAVRRDGDGVRVRTAGSDAEQRFDHVVLATHADTSLALLADADQLERELLGAFEFTDNETVLHEDRTMLPRRSSSIAAWNYQLSACFPDDRRPTMTYSMNRLQGLDTERTLAVTLNRGEEIDERLVHARRWFSHPRFTHAALDAQARLPHLDGRRDTWFCGAWQRHGFHEDGLWSGTRAADSLLERLRDAAPAGHAPGVD